MRKEIERLKIYPQPELIAAYTLPAMASPRACSLLNGMPLAVMACGSSSRSTTSTAPEFHDGKSIAMQQLARKVCSRLPGQGTPSRNSKNSSDSNAALAVREPRIRRQRQRGEEE